MRRVSFMILIDVAAATDNSATDNAAADTLIYLNMRLLMMLFVHWSMVRCHFVWCDCVRVFEFVFHTTYMRGYTQYNSRLCTATSKSIR